MAGVGAEFFGQAARYCYRLLSAVASDNAAVASSRPCCLRSVQGYNNKAAKVYIKLYSVWANQATGGAPASTDFPDKTICVPASAAFVFDFSAGYEFPKGCGLRITGAGADNDATNLVANDVECLNLDFS